MPDREQRLEAVAKLATECWSRWELMFEQQEKIRKAGNPVLSWPRDAFEAYLDCLRTDALEALKGAGS